LGIPTVIVNVVNPITELVSIVVPIAVAIVFFVTELLVVYHTLRSQRRKDITPSLRVQESISKLSKASKDIDNVIRDVLEEMKARQSALDELMKRHDAFLREEKELTQKVETLRQTPIEVAKYFQQITQENLQETEKKRARRDFYFLLAGILLTAATTILLKILRLG
jgi:Na+/phosphate symporter